MKTREDYIDALYELYDDMRIDDLEHAMDWHSCQCHIYRIKGNIDLAEWHKECFDICYYLVDLYYMEY